MYLIKCNTSKSFILAVWDLLEATYPEHFRSHYESCEAYRTIREGSMIHSYQLIPRWFRDKREMNQQRRPTNIQGDEFSYYVRFPSIHFINQSEVTLLLLISYSFLFSALFQVHGRIMGCMRKYKSKEETVKHLLDQYGVAPESTKTGE